MSERETRAERNLENARLQADEAAGVISITREESTTNTRAESIVTTTIFDMNANLVTVENGRLMSIVNMSRGGVYNAPTNNIDRETLNRFLSENPAIYNALDAMDVTAQTIQNGERLNIEIDKRSR
jgi:hypothetical protein